MAKGNVVAIRRAKPEATVDITLALRADITARDWEAVHIAGDRAPVSLRDRLRRLLR